MELEEAIQHAFGQNPPLAAQVTQAYRTCSPSLKHSKTVLTLT